MLTVDFARFPVRPGDRVLDLGCGGGRHSFEALRRGARVIAFDHDASGLADVAVLMEAMRTEGEAPAGARGSPVRGDALALPFPDGSFDRVIAAEILEHLPEDEHALEEIVRVLRPRGLAAVTVPRWLPERICWALSEGYYNTPGGHVRIYTGDELDAKFTRSGLRTLDRHHAHALHSPYWWLKCAVGVERDDHPLPGAYHRLLVWDIMRRPWITRKAEEALDPLIGKSRVTYLRKPESPEGASNPQAEPGAGEVARI